MSETRFGKMHLDRLISHLLKKHDAIEWVKEFMRPIERGDSYQKRYSRLSAIHNDIHEEVL